MIVLGAHRVAATEAATIIPTMEPYSKRGSGLNRCPFVELINASRFLELLDQLHVPEPAEVVVEAARIVIGVTFQETERFRWIRAQHVVATHSKGGVVQQCLPAGHGGGRRFNYFLLLAALYLFAAILGVACHRVLFHWLSEDQIVGQLTIPEPDGPDPVLDDAPFLGRYAAHVVVALFPKSIVVTGSCAQAKVVPIPR